MKKFKYAGLALLFFAILVIQFRGLDIHIVEERYQPCVDYVRQGTLYHGQPQCAEGPVAYLLLALTEALGIGGFAVLGVLHAIFFALLEKTTKKEGINIKTRTLLLLYLLLILLPIKVEIGSFAAAFFLFVGFYFLYETEIKGKEVLAGISLSVSLFSKVNSILVIAPLLLYYLLKINKGNIKEYVKLGAAMVGTAGIFILFFPRVLQYTLLAQALMPPLVAGKKIVTTYLSSVNPAGKLPYDSRVGFFMLLAPLVTIVALIIKRKSAVTFTASLGFIALMYGTIRNSLVLGPHYRYFLSVAPFVLLSIVIVKDAVFACVAQWRIRPVIKGIVYVVIGLILLNGLYGAYEIKAGYDLQSVKAEINRGLEFLPNNTRILMQSTTGISLKEVKSIEVYDVYPEELPVEKRVDAYHALAFKSGGVKFDEEWENWESWDTAHREEYKQKIKEGFYNAILLVGSATDSKIAQDFQEENVNAYKYGVWLPYIRCLTCSKHLLLFFRDQEEAKRFYIATTKYHSEKYEEVKRKSFLGAKIMRTTIKQNLYAGWDMQEILHEKGEEGKT